MSFTVLLLASVVCAESIIPQVSRLVRGVGTFRVPDGACVETLPAFSKDAALPPEGYRLSVSPDGVRVTSRDDAGAFYAVQTLKQLGARDGSGLTLPVVEIEDAPRFGWRGVLHDDVNNFFGKEAVKRLIDLMAAYKFNRLMWHLTGSKGYSVLALGKYPTFFVPKPGRSSRYTEEDVREVVAYARARHVEVVGELEMPAHSPLPKAFPGITCDGKGGPLCAGNEETYRVIEGVLDELIRLFPFEYFHIGGDEFFTRDTWKKCPKCRALMEREGLKDTKELQNRFQSRIFDYLASKGRKGIGWDELLDATNLTSSAAVMGWRSDEVNRRAVARGHACVMCRPYLDYPQGLPDDPYEYPKWSYAYAKWTLERCYAFDPAAGIPKAALGLILGGQCANWSGTTETAEALDWKMWPRQCAVAEALWTDAGRKDWSDFQRRLKAHVERLRSQGVNCAGP